MTGEGRYRPNSDRLRRELKPLRVVHQLNLGQGRAVRRGFEAAKGKYVVQVESNGSYEPAEVMRLWERRLEKHLVLGQRIRRVEPLSRQLGSYLLNRIARLLYKSRLHDPGTPFRLFRRDAATPILASIPPTLESMNIAFSLLMEKQYSKELLEVPIPVRLRPRTKQRRSFFSLGRFAIHSVAELAKLRLTSAKTRLPSDRLARLPA